MSTAAQALPTAAEITGEIEHLTLNDPTNIYSGGVMIVGGTQVILPKNLLIDLPANRLSLQQIFTQAPAACIALGESGLAKADKCNASGGGGFATLSGVHSNAGNIIAGDVLIEKGKEVAFGIVSYINYTDGYFRLNGLPNDPATGVMVRLNDPTSRHTKQQGAGCAGGPNCSADPRFTLDPDNYVITFSTGYPACIPSTVSRNFPGLPAIPASGIALVASGATQAAADGTGDRSCPSTNRDPNPLLSGPGGVERPVDDSRLFAPILVGDSLTAEGNYEAVSGTRFLSAHTMRVNKALATKNLPGQPDYMFLEEVFVEAPGFQNQRTRMLIIGFTTLPSDVDFWTIHRDPTANAIHEFPLATIQGCDIANGAGTCGTLGLGGGGAINAGNNIFRIRYDVDFLMAAAGGTTAGGTKDAKLSPCRQLNASPRFAPLGLCPGGINTAAEFANNFAIMSPEPHEIQARTGHLLDSPIGSLVTLDINGNSATNGQYLFPFGINLGGIETADFLEVDINLLNTPRIFEGLTWNLDRRLSPSGCLNAGGCEAGALGTFALDPFPYTGLDPRLQAGTPKTSFSDPNFTASALTNASNRVFTYVTATGKANGNATLLPYVLGSFPADPALISIVPTPPLNIFPPIAVEDAATTVAGVPVVINVLANDIPVFGTIDPTSVQIASGPASGTVAVNPTTGAITFTPTNPLVTSVSFTYTVANNFGSVSLPGTVTVTIVTAPTPPTVAPTAITPIGPNNLTSAPFIFSAVPGATGYKIYFENNNAVGAFTDITAAQAGCASGAVVCSYTPATPFTPATTFNWLVAGQNANGLGPWSATLNFITSAATPAPPTAISPLGAGVLTNAPFTFSAVPGATGYLIYAENNNAVGGFVSVSAAQAGCPAGTGTCSYTPATPFTAATTYNWLVAAQNLTVLGGFSATLNFITQ